MEGGSCLGCQRRDARIAALEGEVRQLRDEVRQLKALLGRTASNSSLPPSANPPSAPAEAGPGDPPPTRFQTADLPPVRAEVTEYQGHARRCPACGEVTRQAIPAEHCQHSIGPGLAAATAYLAGCHQVSKRGLEEVVETLFEVPVALGTVSNLEEEVSQALAPAHAQAL